jgi:hypothetical protein
MSVEQQLRDQWSLQLKLAREHSDCIPEIAKMDERKQYHHATICAERMNVVIEDMFHTATHFGMIGKQSEKTMVMRARNMYMEITKNLIKKYGLEESLVPTRPKDVRPLPSPPKQQAPPRVHQQQQRQQQVPRQQQQPNRMAQVQNVIVRHGPAAARFMMNNRQQIMRHMQNAYNMAHDALDHDQQDDQQQEEQYDEPQEYEAPQEYEPPQQDYSGGDYGGGDYEY